MVRSTLVTAWFLAGWPTSTSPLRANATTDGVVLAPSEFATTTRSPPSRTATTELVVPRSIPTARAIVDPPDISSFVCFTLLSEPRSTLPSAAYRCQARVESVSLKVVIGLNGSTQEFVPDRLRRTSQRGIVSPPAPQAVVPGAAALPYDDRNSMPPPPSTPD